MDGQKKIEKYQFSMKKVLGEGSYATVYLGKVIQSGEPVAVKVIDKKIFLNAYNLKNIQSQIDIMKMVSHQNIVNLYDIYQTANNMYIVTELCEQGDLYRYLKQKKKLNQVQAIKLLKDIMKGIKYLHTNGITHRDLKPANILIKDGNCKLSDFGFAKNLQDQDVAMKSIVGTPLYMSPQILKRVKYTTKSDLWSMGLIFYQMLHGRTPWPANNQLELINGIYNKKIQYATQVSDKSKRFISACLQINEEHRMSWDQAFKHPLLRDYPEGKKILTQIKKQSIQDKQNINNQNLVKFSFPKSNQILKFRKIKQQKILSANDYKCMTPKGEKTTNKKQGNTPKNMKNIKQDQIFSNISNRSPKYCTQTTPKKEKLSTSPYTYQKYKKQLTPTGKGNATQNKVNKVNKSQKKIKIKDQKSIFCQITPKAIKQLSFVKDTKF